MSCSLFLPEPSVRKWTGAEGPTGRTFFQSGRTEGALAPAGDTGHGRSAQGCLLPAVENHQACCIPSPKCSCGNLLSPGD